MSVRTNNKDKSLMNQLMPSDCVGLWLLLSIAIPFTIVSIASIGDPILTWLEGFMGSFNPELLETEFSLPHIPLGIIVLSSIGLIVCLGLFVILQTKYVNYWYISADRKCLYVPPENKKSILKLTGWLVYRFFYILTPIILMMIVSFGLLFMSINFFNILARLMGHNLEVVLTLGIFISLITGFFWLVAIFITTWNTLTTVYGSIIAITEPEITNTLIRKRSRRFAFLTSSSWGAYIVYLFMMGVFFLEFLYALLTPSFIALNNIHILIIVQLMNIGLFVVLGRSITHSYYKSLLIQYAKISVKKSKILSTKNDLNNDNTFRSSVSLI
ncbi:MAG: hypothetical protein AB1782_11240 [Cyanobacteriota bacterium]